MRPHELRSAHVFSPWLSQAGREIATSSEGPASYVAEMARWI